MGSGARWSLRPATTGDRNFLFELNRAALGSYVDLTWGWDEEDQNAYFDAHFDPSRRNVIQVEGVDVGMLAVEETPEHIYLAGIALLPDWQGQGIGSSILSTLLVRGAESGRPVTLQVLRSNPRAIKLYESFGFNRSGHSDTHVFMRAEPEEARRALRTH
jgi:ribosomal protein S18 acetylase RimI-like enzyme